MTAGCFTKPDFRGDEPATCTTGTPLPTDFVVANRTFFAVNDLDRDGFEDLAMFGHDGAGTPRVYVSFGDAGRALDVACWDRELVAANFFRLAGIRIEISTQTVHMDHGDLFLQGLDAVDHTAIRLEQIEVGSDRTFGAPRAAVASGLTAPAWDEPATAPAAFLVWRFVGPASGEEVLFGGGDKLFTVPMLTGGINAFPMAVDNPTGRRVQQAIDYNRDHFIVDDGIDVFRVARTAVADDLILDTRLGGPAATGAPDGEVFAVQDVRRYANIGAFGLRVPRFATPPMVSAVQLFSSDTVFDRPLPSLPSPRAGGPSITAGVYTNPVGLLGTTIAVTISKLDAGGQPTEQQLAVQGNASEAGAIEPQQMIALDADVVPVLATGTFSDPTDQDLLVVHPRRTTADPPTRSACFRALTVSCLARCGEAACAR